jgi:acyl-CoA reductase-like NAD-dependent aldehyde dehydrogenase
MLSRMAPSGSRASTINVVRRSLSSFSVDNPFTGKEACSIQFHSIKDVNRILTRAQGAQRKWSNETSLLEKIDVVNRAYGILKRNADTLASEVTSMMGKPLGQAKGEINTSADRAAAMNELAINVLADEHHPDKNGLYKVTRKVPVGVVVIIG